MGDREDILNTRIERVNMRIDKLEDQVDRVAAKLNMIMGGVGALGIVALVNLATNIVQTAGGIK